MRKEHGIIMNKVAVCPRCGSTRTEVNDYRFTDSDAVFEFVCLDCMDENESWFVHFRFHKMDCEGLKK